MAPLVTRNAVQRAIAQIISRGEKVTRRAVQAQTRGSMTAVSKTMRMLEASGRIPENGRAPSIVKIDEMNDLASIEIKPLIGSKNIKAYVLIQRHGEYARILYFIADRWSQVGQPHAENIATTVMAQLLPEWDPANTIWGSAGVQMHGGTHDPNDSKISIEIASDQLKWRHGRFEWDLGNRDLSDLRPIALRAVNYIKAEIDARERLRDGDHIPALTKSEKRYLTPGLSSRVMCPELRQEIGFYLTMDPNRGGQWALFACRHGVSMSQNHPFLINLAATSSLIARHLKLGNYPDIASWEYRMFAREIGIPETLDEIAIAYAEYRNAPEDDDQL